MKTQEKSVTTPAPPTLIQRVVNSVSIMSSAALLLSTLAFIGTGLTLNQIAELQRDVRQLKDQVREVAPPPSPAEQPTALSSVTPLPQPSLVPNPAASAEIRPRQFLQPSLSGKGQVELLSVKRVKDPQTGQLNVVNVKFRVHRIAVEVGGVDDSFYAFDTTARNPFTSETYAAFDKIAHSTGTVALYSIGRGSSADGYVWLKVPENVNSLDIEIPQTAAFKNVPITNLLS